MRGATVDLPCPKHPGRISIHAPHAGRDVYIHGLFDALSFISIHAPHAGRDGDLIPLGCKSWNHFNPRAPCGARRSTSTMVSPSSEFQSTRPMRGATYRQRQKTRETKNFNPRAPCGARQGLRHINPDAARFQSTRPMRGATEISIKNEAEFRFQSTRPMRGATRQWHDCL